jgi:hypothetical protein
MKTPSEVVASIKSKNDGTAPKKAANQKSATPKTTGQKAWVPSEMIFKPLSQSVVMILISVTTKKIMDAKKLKALAAYLINSNIYKVIVLVGGTLRRYNFWDSKDYQAKLKSNTTTAFTPPTPQELESEAQGWEVKWQKENADTLEFLKNKLKKGHFQLLPWKEFLKKKNYRGIRNILNTKYQGMEEDLTSTQPSYASTVNTAANIYLKDLIDDKRVLPKHELQAHANIVEYILEEGPVLAPNILEPEIPRVDYLIYPEPMPAAIKASADALVNYTRLIVPEFRVTREEPPEIIGYSGSVEKFVSSLAKQSPTLSSSPSPSPTFDMEESNPASHFPSASGAAPIYFDALTEKDSDHKTTSSKELKEKTQYTSQYTGTTATASKTAKSVNSVYAISDAMKKICEMQNHLPPSASEAAPIQQHRSASIQPRPTFPMNSTSAPMATHQSSLTPKQLSHSDRQMNKHSLFNQNQAFPNPLLFNESDL